MKAPSWFRWRLNGQWSQWHLTATIRDVPFPACGRDRPPGGAAIEVEPFISTEGGRERPSAPRCDVCESLAGESGESTVAVPEELRRRGVTAINVGCSDGRPFEKGIFAHTHGAESPGVICVADRSYLWTADGRPTATLWHEVAHVMVGERERAAHGRLWRDAMKQLGQEIPRRYLTSCRRAR